ncbi:MAG: DivIVA domain-containing protein [Acidimicrobiales bacterium]
MADDHPTISTSRIDAGDVARRTFNTVRRGLDPDEVRTYLELVARALEHADRREQELLHELHEAEERARHPVIDESVLTSSLGQRSAAVLRGAHEEAARILSQAEETAATMVRDAQQQATDIQVNAESSAAERIAEAELEANSLRHQAREEASAVLETARVEGEAVVDRAREHGRAMLDQAQEARRRVLADLAHRRRLVTEQIELFRAARDEIAASVVGVRRSLDRIVEDLSHAEDSARASAAGAATPRSPDVPESVLVEEGERAIAALGEIGEEQRHSPSRDQEKGRPTQGPPTQGPPTQGPPTQGPPDQVDRIAARHVDPGRSDSEKISSYPKAVVPEAQVPEAQVYGASRAGNLSTEPPGPTEPLGRAMRELATHAATRVLRFDDIATVVAEPAHAASGHVAASSGVHESAPDHVDVTAPPAYEAAGDPLGRDRRIEPDDGGTASRPVATASSELVSEEVPPPSSLATEEGVGGADVDGLFARLRARHAVDRLQGDEAKVGPDPNAPIAPADPIVAETAADDVGRGTQAFADGALEAVAEGEEGIEARGEGSLDSAMFARRAEALDPVAATLARRLKRALQDDQNGLLDRLRKGTGEWSDELLLDEASQQAFYVRAATAPLRDAMATGAAFARSAAGGRQPKAVSPDEAAVHEVTGQLASTIVTLLRRRLDTGEISDAAERIGAAYREWRGERIERLAQDSAVEAFSKGVLVGAGTRSVRWSRSEVGPGCADCEDNGLAGAVAPGDAFPTGHRHPPAHAGCRCLVLPTPR